MHKSITVYFSLHTYGFMLSVLEIRVVLLDMSNVFDKIWHEGLIYELRQVGIPGEALAFIITFLNNRFLRLIPKRQSFNWLPTKAVVPQGSFLGFLFLLVYINDSWEKNYLRSQTICR